MPTETLSDTEISGCAEDLSVIWNNIDEANQAWGSSDEEFDNLDEHKVPPLRDELSSWASKYNLPHTSVTDLLKILHRHDLDVPLQSETLRGTPRNLAVQQISGGSYMYLGVANSLKRILSGRGHYDRISLVVNVDGLPIFKSRNISIWPIQCQIRNLKSVEPFVVALFCADGATTSSKPQNLDFLKDFVEEMKTLMNGISLFDGATTVVDIDAIVCDSPARAMVKGTVQFNGYKGCDFCDIQGVHSNGRMLFFGEGTRRTDASFRNREDPAHHKTDTPLQQLPIDMAEAFPIDPMHSVDLGVTKRLLLLWKEGPLGTRLSNGQKLLLSSQLKALAPFMPSIFNRKPRGLEELKMWKATEFRTFLLYLGPLLLQPILSAELYNNFMCLSVAYNILHRSSTLGHARYAAELLQNFVQNSQILYGDYFMTYNTHSLVHLGGSEIWGPSQLHCISL